jgi:hypothetical protein
MKRHAIFVDAGYVFAQGSVSLLGRNTPRERLKLNETEIVRQLRLLAEHRSSGVPLLRVYWYDGARNGPTVEHLGIANMEDVKLRLGSINSVGQQKEVDALLVTDLIDLARNQSICDATVVAGDSDLRIAVQIAQSFGVRVHLVGLEPSRASQSPSLRQEADTVREISRPDVARFLEALDAPTAVVQPSIATLVAAAVVTPGSIVPGGREAAEEFDGEGKTLAYILPEAIERTLTSAAASDILRLNDILATSKQVPTEYDRRLLGTCRALLGRDLTGDERREMRSVFILTVLARVSVP